MFPVSRSHWLIPWRRHSNDWFTSATCRMTYACLSAIPANRMSASVSRQCTGDQSPTLALLVGRGVFRRSRGRIRVIGFPSDLQTPHDETCMLVGTDDAIHAEWRWLIMSPKSPLSSFLLPRKPGRTMQKTPWWHSAICYLNN